MLTALALISIAAVLITKAADLWTTWRFVGARGETNPVGRLLFSRLGVPGGLAVVGALTLLIVALSWSAAFELGAWAIFFLSFWSGVVAVVQGAVAHHNASGRPNFITRRVAAFHDAWARRAER